MVHALESMRRLLRPVGKLVDIHPAAVSSLMEIHTNGKVEVGGEVTIDSWCRDYEAADEALREIVRRGLMVVEEKKTFESLMHYGTADEMRDDRREALGAFAREGESPSEDLQQVDALWTRAKELMATAGSAAEVVIRERSYITRLRPTS